jgi:hypothetical protein
MNDRSESVRMIKAALSKIIDIQRSAMAIMSQETIGITHNDLQGNRKCAEARALQP